MEENIKTKAAGLTNKKTYRTLNVFSVAPLKATLYGAQVTFIMNTTYFLTNKEDNTGSYQIDFGDGAGFRSLKVGSSVDVQYKGTGEKVITTKFTVNGREVYSAARITVMIEKLSTPYKIIQIPAGMSVKPGASPINPMPGNVVGAGTNGTSATSGLRTLGYPAGAQVAIYTNGSSCNQVLDKPVVIIEGFDPLNDVSINALEAKYGLSSGLNGLWQQGFDRVYVSFNDGGDYVENNAQVVQQVIQQINSIKVGNAPSIVIGESMGGLCARMALRQMENAGVPHNVSHYISYDSPHKGANFPPGFQAAVRQINAVDFRSWFGIAQSTMDDAFTALDSPAAQEMLIRYTYDNGSGGIYSPNNRSITFYNFYNQLDGLGLPQQTRNIAISEGDGGGAAQANISDGQDFVGLTFVSGLLNVGLGARSNLSSGVNNVAYLTAFFTAIPTTVKTSEFTGDGLNYDLMPGGFYNIADLAGGYGSIYGNYNQVLRVISSFYPLPVYSNLNLSLQFNFVPTYSSVAYTGPVTNAGLNLSTLSRGNGTPFDRLIFGNGNNAHVRIDFPNFNQDPLFATLLTDLQNTYPGYDACPNVTVPQPPADLSQALNYTYPNCVSGYFYANPVDELHYTYRWQLTRNGQVIRTQSGSQPFYFSPGQQACYTLTLTMQDIVNAPYPSATVSRVVCPPGTCPNGFRLATTVVDENPADEVLTVSPNPADEQVDIAYRTDSTAQVSLVLLTTDGRISRTLLTNAVFTAGSHHYRLNTVALPPAMYLVALTVGKTRKTVKLIINH